ncbi:MAG TPA: hypothetical protein VFQ61_01860 [Polyangiaceae bacterium]|nr:hypothetical protein [Polyangiaceae bacterium]
MGPTRAVPSNDSLGELIGFRVADGLRYAATGAKTRVVSAYDLELHAGATARAMRSIHAWLRLPVEQAFERILGERPPPLSAYVQPTVIRAENSLVIDLDLYCVETKAEKSPAIISKRKSVRGSVDNQSALLEQAFTAASALFQEGEPRRPVARVAGGIQQRFPVGDPVVLDAGLSSDPDSDALVFEWTGPAEIGWRQEGARVTLSPSRPGKYAFMVKVSKLLDRSSSESLVVAVQVVAPPVIRVQGGSMVAMNGRTKVVLDGTCEGCEDWRWTQASGPVTTLPSTCGPDRSAEMRGPRVPTEPGSDNMTSARCEVWADAPGQYVFTLEGVNAIGSASKDVTFGVAPAPVALFDAPDVAVVGHSYSLAGTASHDVFGGNLRYHWEVADQEFPKQTCAPINRTLPAGVSLSTPTQAVTEFSAARPGKYYVRLTVLANRTFGGHASANQECRQQAILVEKPIWWFTIEAGGDFLPEGDINRYWEGFRLKGAVTVRPAFARKVPWIGPSLGLRVAQSFIQSNDQGKDFRFGGGTSLGLALLFSDSIQFHASAFARTWGKTSVGPEMGLEFRVQRMLVLSADVRAERRDNEWHVPVVGGFFGAGYDL